MCDALSSWAVEAHAGLTEHHGASLDDWANAAAGADERVADDVLEPWRCELLALPDPELPEDQYQLALASVPEEGDGTTKS